VPVRRPFRTFQVPLTDYRFEATARFETVAEATRWFALGLDVPASGATPWWIATLRSGSTAANGVEFARRTPSDTWNVTDTAAAVSAAGTGKDVRVRIDVHGMRADWYLDGRKVLSTDELRRSADGRQALLVDGATVSFDDVQVTALAPANPWLRRSWPAGRAPTSSRRTRRSARTASRTSCTTPPWTAPRTAPVT
jgi:glycerophosphoryl diester phosphodiesterase